MAVVTCWLRNGATWLYEWMVAPVPVCFAESSWWFGSLCSCPGAIMGRWPWEGRRRATWTRGGWGGWRRTSPVSRRGERSLARPPLHRRSSEKPRGAECSAFRTRSSPSARCSGPPARYKERRRAGGGGVGRQAFCPCVGPAPGAGPRAPPRRRTRIRLPRTGGGGGGAGRGVRRGPNGEAGGAPAPCASLPVAGGGRRGPGAQRQRGRGGERTMCGKGRAGPGGAGSACCGSCERRGVPVGAGRDLAPSSPAAGGAVLGRPVPRWRRAAVEQPGPRGHAHTPPSSPR